ncbi:hypothetical protein MRY87_12350 [bacterium]|nr:hypothetical protein [bacterium]
MSSAAGSTSNSCTPHDEEVAGGRTRLALASPQYSQKQPPQKKQSSKHRAPFLWEYRISAKEFAESTSAAERELLRISLNEAMVHFLSLGKVVYLEKLGLFIPKSSRERVSHQLGEDCVIRTETKLRISFEKCSELIPYHRERYPEIVETPELSRFIYARLPLHQQTVWSEKVTRRFVRGLNRVIRDEVIVDGFSHQLSEVGELFALHNRQGDNPDDWFAGADLLLRPLLVVPLEAEIQSRRPQPALTSSWELLEAGLGTPLAQFQIDLAEELEALGYDRSTFTSMISGEQRILRIGTFLRKEGEKTRIIFCTDGLREGSLSRNESQSSSADEDLSIGSELVIQLPSQNIFREEESLSQDELGRACSSALLPRRMLTLGWILLQSSPDKAVPFGCGLSAEAPLDSHSSQLLTGIFSTPYRLIPLSQKYLREDGRTGWFQYVNIVGVTEDELRFSQLRSPQHLLSLLSCKDRDQLTLVRRKSIFLKSEHFVEYKQKVSARASKKSLAKNREAEISDQTEEESEAEQSKDPKNACAPC